MGDPRFATLPNLGWFEPRRWMPTHIVNGLAFGASSTLGVTLTTSGGAAIAKMSATTRGTTAEQRLRAFVEPHDSAYMEIINRQLAGERDYPVVGKILGSVVGKLGIDLAGGLYSVASGALGGAESSAQVFVRDKDEIWRTEAIGKAGQIGKTEPIYVLTYLLVDPYRSSPARAAWILHEQRYPLVE